MKGLIEKFKKKKAEDEEFYEGEKIEREEEQVKGEKYQESNFEKEESKEEEEEKKTGIFSFLPRPVLILLVVVLVFVLGLTGFVLFLGEKKPEKRFFRHKALQKTAFMDSSSSSFEFSSSSPSFGGFGGVSKGKGKREKSETALRTTTTTLKTVKWKLREKEVENFSGKNFGSVSGKVFSIGNEKRVEKGIKREEIAERKKRVAKVVGGEERKYREKNPEKRKNFIAERKKQQEEEEMERDVFKEFFLGSSSREKSPVVKIARKKSELKKELKHPLPRTLTSGGSIAGYPVPEAAGTMGAGVLVGELQKIKIYGFDCGAKGCVAITNIGKLREGDEIGKGEVVEKITPDRIKTNYRIIFY